MNKNNFNSLRKDVYNNVNNDEFKTNVNNKTYDLKIQTNFRKNKYSKN